MKKSNRLAVLCFALSACLQACSQNDTPTPSGPGNNNNNTDGFSWKEDGGALVQADSAFWTSGGWGAGIRAYKGGMSRFFEINFSDAAPGSKSLAQGFTYLNGNDTYNATAGTLTVADTAGGKLSGSFNVSLSGGSITAIEGTFTHLPAR